MYRVENNYMKKTILLIEDSKTQLESIKLVLLRSGYEVITAIDGAEGICAAYQKMPDIIVSDIVMPNVNGYQLCRLLKNDEETKEIPIILLTILNKKLDRFWGMRAGADAYIVKDENMSSLVEEIDKLLKSKTNISRNNKIKQSNVQEISFQSKINDILDQALMESIITNDFRNLSEFVLDTKVLNKGIFSLISSIIDYNVAGIFFNDRDEKKEKMLNLTIHDSQVEDNVSESIKAEFFSIIFPNKFKDVNDYSHEIFERSINKSSSINNLSQLSTKIIVPIVYADRILGGICLYQVPCSKTIPSRIFNIILEELRILMRIKWLYSETKFLAITDGLTGLYNRRYFQQTVDIEFARAKRYSHSLSLALFDIDHFKNINDTYGHQFGDKVLTEISKIIRDFLRKTDYVARYGGEEIIAILPETDFKYALIPMERLRKSIEEHGFDFGEKSAKVTVSIGIAFIDPSVASEDELIKRADESLYIAKQNGRNRVELYPGTLT